MSRKSLPLERELVMNEVDTLWDQNSEKYKCCCRLLHVKKASLYIAYAQIMATLLFGICFSFYYMQAINGQLSTDHWINELGERYISSLIIAVAIQLLLVLFLIKGIGQERRSLLIPFMASSSIALVIGFNGLRRDFFGFINNSSYQSFYTNNKFFLHLTSTMIHIWCVSIVWRCYGYLGDKKIARQIGEQLSVTHVAFQYGKMPYDYVAMPQPPPYADTVISLDKQPLTIA